MIDTYMTLFLNKNLKKIEKELNEQEEISITEAKLFPKEFREIYVKPYREFINKAKRGMSSSEYKGDITFNVTNCFEPGKMLSISLFPFFEIKSLYIDFYKNIINEIISALNRKYPKGILTKTNSFYAFKTDNNACYLRYSSLGFSITFNTSEERRFFKDYLTESIPSILEEKTLEFMDIFYQEQEEKGYPVSISFRFERTTGKKEFEMLFKFDLEQEVVYHKIYDPYGFLDKKVKDEFFVDDNKPIHEIGDIKTRLYYDIMNGNLIDTYGYIRNVFELVFVNMKKKKEFFKQQVEKPLFSKREQRGFFPDYGSFGKKDYQRILFLNKKLSNEKILKELNEFLYED